MKANVKSMAISQTVIYSDSARWLQEERKIP